MPFVEEKCSSCGGTGYVWPDKNTQCIWCNGSGKVKKYVSDAPPETQQPPGVNYGGNGCIVMLLFFIGISSLSVLLWLYPW